MAQIHTLGEKNDKVQTPRIKGVISNQNQRRHFRPESKASFPTKIKGVILDQNQRRQFQPKSKASFWSGLKHNVFFYTIPFPTHTNKRNTDTHKTLVNNQLKVWYWQTISHQYQVCSKFYNNIFILNCRMQNEGTVAKILVIRPVANDYVNSVFQLVFLFHSPGTEHNRRNAEKEKNERPSWAKRQVSKMTKLPMFVPYPCRKGNLSQGAYPEQGRGQTTEGSLNKNHKNKVPTSTPLQEQKKVLESSQAQQQGQWPLGAKKPKGLGLRETS